MNIQDLNLLKTTKLVTQLTEDITCLECCKYYIAPATAGCGHTLCHTCWRGRRTCPTCGAQLDRKCLKLNLPLQTLTNNVRVVGEAFEKLFKVKLDEFNLDTPGALEETDPNKNVKDWLTSSQNHFSAAIQNSESFSQEVEQPVNPLEISSSNIIIHTDTKKAASPPKIVHVPPPQDDWDKIEALPDPDENKKVNVVGPMDIEPFFVEDDEYTMDNPRRSSRKRELKSSDSVVKTHELSSNKHSSRDSSGENDKKSQKNKQTWSNVKRMRKEFSKLNKKKNRSKLNVSIEMVKKTQISKPNIEKHVLVEQIYIDDNTPNNEKKDKENANTNIIEPMDDTREVPWPKGDTSEPFKERQIIDKIIPTNNESNSSKAQILQDAGIENDNIKISKDISPPKRTENIVVNHNHEPEVTRMPFIRKGSLNPNRPDNPLPDIPKYSIEQPIPSESSDDIEISIRVGNTVTNIVIKKKQSDVQVKINTDREVQTSIGPHHLYENKKSTSQNCNKHNVDIAIENNVKDLDKSTQVMSNIEKSTSGKKNTASADTATVQFEITESVEKELSKIMEVKESEGKTPENVMRPPSIVQKPNDIVEDYENIDDIFNSGSVKEANVHFLKEHAPSEILVSTVQSKLRTQKHADKRERDNDEETQPKNKKTKINQEELKDKTCEQPDSEPNYDAIMGQVFANIDADIEDIRKSQEVESGTILKDMQNINTNKEKSQSLRITSEIQNTQVTKKLASQRIIDNTPKSKEFYEEKHSENVFSILEKEDENSAINKTEKVPQPIDEFLTPVQCHNLDSSQESVTELDKVNKSGRKTQDCDDDKSVVEETPQKNVSFTKLKRASTANQSQINETKRIPARTSTSNINSIINLADTMTESNKSSKDVTVINTEVQRQALETPLTITKFVDQVKHKSTPLARKSLNFDNENEDNDPEQTLCPTSEVVAKTTQEKEFMSKAFENTPPVVRPLLSRNVGLNTNRRLCLAASCLTPSEISKVKSLCNARKWCYVDKYTKDITHLIVGVDEERKSQRSVKYMCALAASKWIVSYEWVLKCLQTKEVVNEEHFEALDSTGEPGPRRSRIAKQKLFDGITFYCMPPFSVLDVETLEKMLTAAGGCVVNDAKQVQICDDNRQPALLLAEPEHTQEDRFIYLAMEQRIVPVNYEWVLNCLGSYTLSSIHELLLCPSTLLPEPTVRWPSVLIAQDDD